MRRVEHDRFGHQQFRYVDGDNREHAAGCDDHGAGRWDPIYRRDDDQLCGNGL